MEEITKTLKKYLVEIIVLSTAVLTTIIAFVVYMKNNQEVNFGSENIPIIYNEVSQKPTKIYVEVSGSVNKPDLYEASDGVRLKELIEKAGGLSKNADTNFFARNFNLARIPSDQEKIYIPSVWEVSNGYFTESLLTVYGQKALEENTENLDKNMLININSSSVEELDTLPGIGKVTADKIIKNRPFKALQDLIEQKVVNKSVYENIKELITI